jgi:site-specific DNA-cytosine methylase
MSKPLAIDLFCGLGGWTEGLLAEGYRVVGFDNERHVYGKARYPAQLVIMTPRDHYILEQAIKTLCRIEATKTPKRARRKFQRLKKAIA